MGRGQNLLNLVKKIKQEKQIEEIKTEIAEVIKPENLKAGITAFGIEGNKNIVDTSDANLNEYYLHPNYIGYSKGSKIKGRMPVSTEDQLQYFSSTQTMLNPEYPNFILLRHYSTGTIKGEIKTISASAINSEWIENKNICIRANYNPNLTYWKYDWHVEIAVCENDCRFQFRNSNGEQPIYCIYKDTGNSAPYTLYQAWCNDLSELTIDNWEKKDIAANSNMNNSLGKIGSLYAYSRDKSVTTTGLTSSTGIMSSKGKIYFKNKLNANTTPSYLSNNNNGAFIDIIDENKLTQFINLIPEHIKKGETYLGIEGTMEEGIDTSDATAVASDIAIGKTAYVNGEKITGSLEFGDYNAEIDTSITPVFSVLNCITKINKLDTSNCTSITFRDCSFLEEIPEIDISKLTNTNSMFYNCKKIKTIPLINTNKITNMSFMFYYCNNLESIPLIDTSNVTIMDSMFYYCNKLESIPQLITSKCTNMHSMFYYCTNLKGIPQLDTSNATNTNGMFYHCDNLITAPSIDISKVTDAGSMFGQCVLLSSVPEYDVSSLYRLGSIFYNCGNLTNLGGLVNLGKGYTIQTKNNANQTLNLSYSPLLTHDSLMNIINNLYDLNLTYNVAGGGTLYTQSLVLGDTNLNKLTAEEIAIATNKGWTVS